MVSRSSKGIFAVGSEMGSITVKNAFKSCIYIYKYIPFEGIYSSGRNT